MHGDFMKKLLSYSLFFLLPYIALNADLVGTYNVQGFDPSVNQTYTGTVDITQNGETFTGYWTFNDGTHETGTGIRTGHDVSFVFQGVGDSNR